MTSAQEEGRANSATQNTKNFLTKEVTIPLLEKTVKVWHLLTAVLTVVLIIIIIAATTSGGSNNGGSSASNSGDSTNSNNLLGNTETTTTTTTTPAPSPTGSPPASSSFSASGTTQGAEGTQAATKFTSQSARYLVKPFSDPASGRSAVVRSLVRDGVSVTKSEETSTIIGGAAGHSYNITIPSGDDLFHLTLLDQTPGVGNAVARFTFIWEDSTFEGNADQALPAPVAPTVTMHSYGSGGAPILNSNAAQARSPNQGGNTLSIYGFDERSITVDVLFQDSVLAWWTVSFSF